MVAVPGVCHNREWRVPKPGKNTMAVSQTLPIELYFWTTPNGYNHFNRYSQEKVPYALARFGDEAHRLFRVLDERLRGRAFVAGDYSVADIALFGWMRNWDRRGIDIAEFPEVKRWHDVIAARPA